MAGDNPLKAPDADAEVPVHPDHQAEEEAIYEEVHSRMADYVY